MPDDKGPYTLKLIDDGYKIEVVYGPSFNSYCIADFTGSGLVTVLNAAYAEGRKSAEKDFKELLELANGLRHCIGNTGPHGRKEWEKNFDAWKKARGIE